MPLVLQLVILAFFGGCAIHEYRKHQKLKREWERSEALRSVEQSYGVQRFRARMPSDRQKN